jgi:polysaccharide export outer membrane protein
MLSMLRVLICCFATATVLPLHGAVAAEKPAKAASAKSESAPEAPPADYVIQPLDLIRIQIYQEPDLSRELRVSQEGNVELPLIRMVDLKNKTVRQAEELIRKLYDADYLVNPQINITVLEYAQRWVEVFGQVQNPGLVQFPKEEGLTLTTAISKAGSFTRLGNPRKVTLKRTYTDGRPPETFTINVEDLTKGASNEAWPLQQGDVITVPERSF